MTYTTLDGATLDLSGLTQPEREFFDVCMAAYEERQLGWVQVTNLVWSRVNPLVDEDGMIDREAQEHPLFVALRDLEDRLGIREGELAPEPAAGLSPLNEPARAS